MKKFNLPIGCFTPNPLLWGQLIDQYYFYNHEPFDNAARALDMILYRRVIVQNSDGYLYLVTSYNEYYHQL